MYDSEHISTDDHMSGTENKNQEHALHACSVPGAGKGFAWGGHKACVI